MPQESLAASSSVGLTPYTQLCIKLPASPGHVSTFSGPLWLYPSWSPTIMLAHGDPAAHHDQMGTWIQQCIKAPQSIWFSFFDLEVRPTLVGLYQLLKY